MRGIGAAAAERRGQIERLEIGIVKIGIAAKLVQGKPAIAIGIRQRRVAAGDISPIVDQALREAVPARRLHIAIGVVIHVIGGQRPGAGGEIARHFQELIRLGCRPR